MLDFCFLCGLIGLLWHSRESVQCLSMRELAIKWAMSDFAEKMAIVLLINRRGFKTIFLERMGVAGKKTCGYLESNLTVRCFLDSQSPSGKCVCTQNL